VSTQHTTRERVTPVSTTCRHCGHVVRQNGAQGGLHRKEWGTTLEHDPNDGHPWWCESSPDASKRHEPSA
jgi:hypothetical protein